MFSFSSSSATGGGGSTMPKKLILTDAEEIIWSLEQPACVHGVAGTMDTDRLQQEQGS